MPTIDMTPTREQTVRIYAYILAGHSDTSPYRFGDYWDYTEEQEQVIAKTYLLWDAFTDVWENAGFEIADIPKATKKKFINGAIKKAAN